MTVAEQIWLDQSCALGCIVCITTGKGKSPAEPHHLLSGGRRRGDLFTIPLCQKHHRSGSLNKEWVSRHPWRMEFIKRYGTEESLLAKTRELIGAPGASKDGAVAASMPGSSDQ